jgi:hypothetical protein
MLPLVIITLTLIAIALLNQFPTIADVTNAPSRSHNAMSLSKCNCKWVAHLSHYVNDGKETRPIYLYYKHVCPKCKHEKEAEKKAQDTPTP